MSDKPTWDRFNTSEELLQVIKEHSDDIDKAFTIPKGNCFSKGGVQMTGPTAQNTLGLRLCNGKTLIMHEDDGKMVIADGILDRLRIKVVHVDEIDRDQ